VDFKNTKIIIGKQDTAWQSLLDSEGVLWSNAEQSLPRSKGGAVLVLTQKTSDLMRSFAQLTLHGGGSVIAEPGAFPRQQGSSVDSIFYPYHRNTFSGFLSDSDRNSESLEIVFSRNQPGTVFYLPFELHKFWCDHQVQRHYVCTEEKKNPLVWENLPAVLRKNVRHVVTDVLKMAFHAAGFPFVHKSYWPQGCRTVFCFRADMDAGNQNCLLRFINAVRPWSESLSMFVCGQAYHGNTTLLKKVAALPCEIGNHTYTHYVYNNAAKNRANLELTERILETVGIRPTGYVGPASFWHPSMYDVLQEKGYQYTSSFGIDHDNLPYFPVRNSKEIYDLVEIPFHCLGDRFPKFGMRLDSPEVSDFFNRLIEKKYMAAEPITIYGHPDMKDRLGDYPELVEKICERALSLTDIWTGNMAELANWWRERHAVNADILVDSTSKVILARDFNAKTDIFWSIHTADGRWFLEKSSRLKEGIRLDDLTPRMPLLPKGSTDIGEIISTSFRPGLISVYQTWRRSLRRKLKKVRELKTARLQLGE
jgi:hypothetical protein